MDDQELRRWAVEQVVMTIPADSYADALAITAEASRLVDYVTTGATLRPMTDMDRILASANPAGAQ